MWAKRLSIPILLGFILLGCTGVFIYCGYTLWLQEGWNVIRADMTEKNLASLSVFIILPFGFGGMLLAVYHFSVDLALRILEYSAGLVSVVGSILNFFFSLLISIHLF